ITAHRVQGATMTKVKVDLAKCRGTEAPYVMISRVRSLEGLVILRDFDLKVIQCRQSEDSRREGLRLQYLELLT
ncbi:hypothetical protein K435DRAFT_611255, partial [Dendrothele bispora CBS 962.96]